MWYQLISYINFLYRSSNQHGVHSPFVYDLITKCFYDKKKYANYFELKKIRNDLQYDDRMIEILDFGEGSRIFNSSKRKVSSIAKYAGISSKRQRLLYRLVRYFNSETILELGTSVGMASATMALANPSAKITTVEGCKNTAVIAQEVFEKYGLENIQLNLSDFSNFLSEINSDSLINTTEKYDLIYIDGNHNKDDTIQYFDSLLDHIQEQSVMILDDIYWSPSMTEAWEKIIQHPKVITSINTFYWGLLFFKPAFKQANKEQQKKHFNIRL